MNYSTTTKKQIASKKIPPPPPLSLPVYSFASPILPRTTEDTATDRTSMNIVTFASAVSVSPPKLWILSLYLGTLTHDAFLGSKYSLNYDEQNNHNEEIDGSEWGVLQILRPEQKHLVSILGKQSGYDVDKAKQCEEVGCRWVNCLDVTGTIEIQLLQNCASYIQLRLVNTLNNNNNDHERNSSFKILEAGDHNVALCLVEGIGIYNTDTRSISWLADDESLPPMDPSSVLYTGLLREEKLI